eukprot:gnl/TRDRNA2_/TRDRNA2_174533_c1_seq2.p1 gnl/TRDRNA2_/TRDRNA2_174533_c1~~gnl/TRDRNA2_/TRDRNA2_174533_c1_seq2.p1  ORF type:complete len:172 (-),score=15.04 gnl/TRDRNA2_/TRDRNA2_174533_c1_seq2:254-769(-)
MGCCRGQPRSDEFMAMTEKREHMAVCNGRGLTNVQLSGTCTENGKTKPFALIWNLDTSGNFTGESKEKGASKWEEVGKIFGGKLNWEDVNPNGAVMWGETQGIEGGGIREVESEAVITMDPSGSNFVVNVQYITSENGENDTRGTLALSTAGGPVGTVVGASTAWAWALSA